MLNISQAVKQSVNDVEPPDYAANRIDWYFGLVARRNEILLPWAYPGRDWQLRSLRYNVHNTLVVAALANIIRRFKQLDYELVGGRNLTRKYQNLLQDAQYGLGYDVFCEMVLWDYFTLDNGAFIEVIGRGEPDTPLKGEVTGLAALDGLRCYATGNPEFPVYYQSHITGKVHKMHWTRVIRLVDQPSSDPQYKQRGLSAMSRAAAIAKIQVLMSEYQVERLGDLPPAGIISLSGINMNQWEGMYKDYQAKKQNAGNDVFSNMMIATGVKPDTPVKVDLTPFSNLPEHFNWNDHMSIAVNLLALAIGDDPQEIWTLSGQALGTGAQSKVLHAKGQARVFGDLIKLFTRMWNLRVLPESLELRYKPKDSQQSESDAAIAEKWTNIANANVQSGNLTKSEARQLLANTTQAIADVLLDETGQVRLPDDDVSSDEPEIIADDETTTTTEEAQEQTTADDDTALETRARKDIQAVALDFEDAFEDMLSQAYSGNMTRSRAGIVARAIVGRGVADAYREGLKIGGVDPEDISEDDLATIRSMQVSQSVYITEMLNKLYKDETTTQGTLESKPEMWFNKSVYPAYDAGLMSADKNGYYEWVYGDTEHCDDCRRLNGQIHRLKDWDKSGWKPKSSRLKCSGYKCACIFQKRTGVRARGSY